MENITTILNGYLRHYWVIILFGLLWGLWLERGWVMRALTSGRPKKVMRQVFWAPIIRRAWYVFGGGLVVLSSWQFVIWTLHLLVPAAMPGLPVDPSVHQLVNSARTWTGSVALMGVFGFIAAGTCLTLSAGSRWLVTVAKLLATATILGMASVIIIAYFP